MKYKLFWSLLILFLFNSCLEDVVDPPIPPPSMAARVLTYLEANRYDDLFDTFLSDQEVDVDTLHNRLTDFVIIDIRNELDFKQGHIPSSINVLPSNLLSYYEKNLVNSQYDIVLISKNGQSAAYYTALFRLLGYDNVKFLEYGLSIWNRVFADDWIKINSNFSKWGTFRRNSNPKAKFQSLPQISASTSDVMTYIRIKVEELFMMGYEPIAKDIDYFYSGNSIVDAQIICYGPNNLYQSFELGHPPGTIQFLPDGDLKSSGYLQTLPNNLSIGVYDWNGHKSAITVAYLRLIGYEVFNIHFGAYAMIYDDFRISRFKQQFVLTDDKIRDFDYIK